MVEKVEIENTDKADVKIVNEYKLKRRVKILKDPEIISQFKEAEDYEDHIKKIILYGKIAGGISLISLLIAIALLGLAVTANAVSSQDKTLLITRGIISALLFLVGLATFMLALQLDKKKKKLKPRKKKTKKKPKKKK